MVLLELILLNKNLIIETIGAFAEFGASDPRPEALAVFLLASSLGAITPSGMQLGLLLGLLDLGLECRGILLLGLKEDCVPEILISLVIKAVPANAGLVAELIVLKTLAI